MPVLVTGATGRLGQELIARLLAEGRQVAVLTRRPFRASELFGATVAVHEWHPGSEPVPAEALEGASSIVHLMGAPFAGGPARQRAEFAAGSRTETTRRLVEAISGRPMRLLVASVALAPEGSDAASPLAESDAAAIPYSAAGELLWETEARAAAEQGASVAIVRLGLLAAAGPFFAELVALARTGLGIELDGALVPAIDPIDAAALLSGLLDRPDMTGLFFGVAPEPVKGEALSDALAKASRVALPMLVPRRLIAQRVGLLAPLLTSRRRVVPQRLIEAGAAFTTPNPTRLCVSAIEALIRERGERQRLLQRIKKSRPGKPEGTRS